MLFELINNFANSKNNTSDCNRRELIIADKKISSLDELRENFDAKSILSAFEDGSLVNFLKEQFYEREAEIISGLSLKDGDSLRIICETLGVEYLKQDFVLTPDVKKRLEILKQYTLDNSVLSNFERVALNQNELASLLNNGETIIYLCNGNFSIPLSKKGVKYIGVASPTIENPFTLKMYKNAGISVENIALPSEVSEKMSEYALRIAKENGYDDYAENNSPLATYFHNKLKAFERFSYIRIPYSLTQATKEYKSEYSAKQELRENLRKAYDKANSYVTAENSNFVAKTTAEEYSSVIKKCFYPIMESLESLCTLKGKEKSFKEIAELVAKSEKTLMSIFKEEITNNQDYYDMYDFDYFFESVSIEEHDYRTGEGIFKAIETLFADSIEYTYSNFFETISEMEKDINDHISSFYKFAYREYLEYVKEIEKVIETLGNDYPEFKENETINEYLTRIATVES